MAMGHAGLFPRGNWCPAESGCAGTVGKMPAHRCRKLTPVPLGGFAPHTDLWPGR